MVKATVKMDDEGRCVIPATIRRKLDIHGDEAYLELDIKKAPD